MTYTSRRLCEYTSALVGRVVLGVDVSEGEEALRFRCADGADVVWATDADCCSETWWADGFQLDSLRGATVRAVAEIEMPDYDVEDGRTRQDVDAVYGVRIDTDKGTATFAFRNSSNGYYGGEAYLDLTPRAREWREVVGDDWTAAPPPPE